MTPDFSIQQLIDLHLAARSELRGERPVVNDLLWRGSRIGMCLRSQMLQARGVPSLRDIDARTRRVFAVGDILGWWIVNAFADLGILLGKEVPFADPELRAGGNVDAIIGGPIQDVPDEDMHPFRRDLMVATRTALKETYGSELPVIGLELKTKNSRSWHYSSKNNGVVAGRHQLLQAAFYRVLNERVGTFEIDKWVIVSVSKDDLLISEDGCTLGHVNEVYRRLAELNGHYEENTWPDCTCGGDDGKYWERKFCNFKSGDTCCLIPEEVPLVGAWAESVPFQGGAEPAQPELFKGEA